MNRKELVTAVADRSDLEQQTVDAVLRGEADAYLHDGGQWEWDSAAPVGVVQAAGLHASRIDGTPLLYNREHPYLPDLLIARAELAAPILEAIAAAT